MGIDVAVSQQEFEAGLSLLDMMQRNPSQAETQGEAQGSNGALPTKVRDPSGPHRALLDASLLKAVEHQALSDKSSSDDVSFGGVNGQHPGETDNQNGNESWGGNRGFLRRNAQLNTLSRELNLDELRGHFGKPIVEVAREFGICTTFLKKICRRCGIKRWPHRQIRSLSRTIQMLRQAESNSTSAQEKLKFANQIRQLEAKMQAVIEDPDANGKLERVKKCSAVKNAAALVNKAIAASASTSSSPVPPLFISTANQASTEGGTFVDAPPPTTPSARVHGKDQVGAASAAIAAQSLSVQNAKNMLNGNSCPMMGASLSPGYRISPSHRKLMVHHKSSPDNRMRKSSIGSLQDESEI